MLSVNPGDGKGIYVAALTLFIDDSGTAPNQEIAVAAGLISPLEEWRKFEKKWDRAKADAVDGFACFHSSECVARNPKSEFAAWDDAKVSRVLKTLRAAIKSHTSCALAIAVVKKDYNDWVDGELRKEWKNHYTFAFRCMMGALHAWMLEHGHEKSTVEIVHDYLKPNDPRRKELQGVFDKARNSDGVCFKDRCKITPLQATDILAWATYQKALNYDTQRSMSPFAKATIEDFAKRGPDWLRLGIYRGRELEERVRLEKQKLGIT